MRGRGKKGEIGRGESDGIKSSKSASRVQLKTRKDCLSSNSCFSHGPSAGPRKGPFRAAAPQSPGGKGARCCREMVAVVVVWGVCLYLYGLRNILASRGVFRAKIVDGPSAPPAAELR